MGILGIVEVKTRNHEVSIRRFTYTFLMLQVSSATMLTAIPYRSVLQILQFPTAAQQSIGEASATTFIKYHDQNISPVMLSGIAEINHVIC